MTKQIVHVIGGGTRFHLDSHLYLGAKALGHTAREVARLCRLRDDYDVRLHLTNMAEPFRDIPKEEQELFSQGWEYNQLDTNEDVKELVLKVIADPLTKIVFFNAAMIDFDAHFQGRKTSSRQWRHATKSEFGGGPISYDLKLTPSEKIVRLIRRERKDIFLVAWKQTWMDPPEEQYRKGLDLLKSASANLVLANDTESRINMIIVPEEATYHVTSNRNGALSALVRMAYQRSKLHFTRSTVADGDFVPWGSELVPQNLRTVVDHCILRGAYKPFRGVTAGHFAVKIGEGQFLTSRRKTNFNNMNEVGLVRVETDGPNAVIAYGGRPSVGGQSQRIVFAEHPDTDCIVHFHAVPKEGSVVPTVSQQEFECGSHECGENTSRGLERFGDLYAVNLDNHGPNIVFSKEVDPRKVIDFIEENFDLETKSGGYAVA